jgi:hypothetical protein
VQPAHVAEEVCGLLVDVQILQNDHVLLEHIAVWMILVADDGEGVVLEDIPASRRLGMYIPISASDARRATGSIIDMEEKMGADHDELQSIQTAQSWRSSATSGQYMHKCDLLERTQCHACTPWLED